MATTHNKRQLIEHLRIYLNLVGQSFERIAITFNFVTAYFTVQYGDINANRARPHTHFVDDPRAEIIMVFCQHAGM